MPLTDDDVDRIAQAVWARLVSVPDKDPQPAQWVLGQTYVMTQRTVRAAEEAAGNTR